METNSRFFCNLVTLSVVLKHASHSILSCAKLTEDNDDLSIDKLRRDVICVLASLRSIIRSIENDRDIGADIGVFKSCIYHLVQTELYFKRAINVDFGTISFVYELCSEGLGISDSVEAVRYSKAETLVDLEDIHGRWEALANLI